MTSVQDLPAMLANALLTNIHDHYTAVWPDRKLLCIIERGKEVDFYVPKITRTTGENIEIYNRGVETQHKTYHDNLVSFYYNISYNTLFYANCFVFIFCTYGVSSYL